MRDVAKLVGARTDADEKCRGNIQIVFTTKPQELLDNLRRKHSSNLGYYDTAEQANEMTVLKRPVHAYYATQTADLRGNRQIDTKKNHRHHRDSSRRCAGGVRPAAPRRCRQAAPW